jgi:hypothetical protein
MLSIADKHGVPSVSKWVHLSMNPRLTSIKTVKIYSPIGIARVGNSPEDWFIGPERVGDEVAPEGIYFLALTKNTSRHYRRSNRISTAGGAAVSSRKIPP